jgi:CubicO group peptidase (beta-lactamase class C family)
MGQLVEKGMIPNHVTLVARKGKIVHLDCAGTQNDGSKYSLAPQKTPVSADTIFRIYSMSKPITSVCLMQLFEQGKFLLSQPVHLYLGEKWKKKNMQVFASGHPRAGNMQTTACEKSITMKHVLTHTAGLTYGFDAEGVANPVDWLYSQKLETAGQTLEQFCDKLADLPLLFTPGECYHYGYNTDVCARLVEVISGQKFSDYLQKHVLGPLNMTDTSFNCPPEKRHRLADNYVELAGKPAGKALRNFSKDSSQAHYTADHLPAFESGGGGLLSTAHDYYRFCQMLLNKGELDGARLLSRKTVEWMTTNHLPDHKAMTQMPSPVVGYTEVGSPGVGFGLGVSVVLDPEAGVGQVASVGSFSWGGAAHTGFWVDPQEELVVIWLTQVMQQDQQRTAIRPTLGNIVYGSIVDGAAPGSCSRL